jgi:putative ABC transport system permease protein
MRGLAELERFGGDLRYAARQLLIRPAWTLVVVTTLALGVGANTSIFTLIDALLFRPAIWNAADRFVWIASLDPRTGRVGRISYADYLLYRDRTATLSGVLAYGGSAMSIGGSRPERVLGGVVSGNYFDVLGIRAALGRTFAPDEGEPGGPPVVVLSHALWREHFRSDAAVLNEVVAINGRPFTIIGVAPPGFTGVAYADDPEQLWVGLAMQDAAMPTSPGLLRSPTARWLRVAGRLEDGATVARADAEVRAIDRLSNGAATAGDREVTVRVTPMRGGLNPWERTELAPVFGLIAIVPALVLLVACTNVSNAVMARNVSRRRELAMRRALGASRGRLVRLLLTESLLLALLSGAVGFIVSFGIIPLIAHYGAVPPDPSGLLTPDRRALVATTAIALATLLFVGLAPALTGTGFDVLPALNAESWTSTAAIGGTCLRRVFVVAQVAVSLVLLISAGLFLQSLAKAVRVDPGFDPHGVVTASFDLTLQGYTAPRRDAFLARVVERISSTPGVSAAALTDSLPLGTRIAAAQVVTESTDSPAQVTLAGVSPGYFETMRIALVRGRDFTAMDSTKAPLVAIVNETLARRLWPEGDAIGRRVRAGGASEPWRVVIGIVADAKFASLTESPLGACYVPLRQRAASLVSVVLRVPGEAGKALSSVAAIVRDLDPDLPLFEAQPLERSVHQAARLQRAAASLFSVFAALALLLAAIGVYGVAAHSVSLRTREVGIRMSLGARSTDVFRMFVGENLSLALVGVAIGLAISAAVLKVLATFLFGLTAMDTLTFAGGAAILCGVAIAASGLPARRAARVDPAIALRQW